MCITVDCCKNTSFAATDDGGISKLSKDLNSPPSFVASDEKMHLYFFITQKYTNI